MQLVAAPTANRFVVVTQYREIYCSLTFSDFILPVLPFTDVVSFFPLIFSFLSIPL